ncbi:MAG: 4Fe-4S dicluster domain-containing protein [Candidatus Tectomicrobia bacterium]|uniref:4Fe-4S dicluster domain-containing protein n=1 Tax=Tectimicrobiota bacterium TaxID=2528274 RepID=A0A932CNR1_UNCTE|nr:4Fe-4S dicluster domain-containing protein [Candidatus Tectomicrobia bacterium]
MAMPPKATPESVDRREFFRQAWGWAARKREEAKPKSAPISGLLRPPGAAEEREFMALCRRCGACRQACPHGSLLPAGPEAGEAEGTPILLPRKFPCQLCEELPCIAACPSGALKPLASRREVRIGVAVLAQNRCLAWDDQPCQLCLIRCPLAGEALYQEEWKPVVVAEKCTGCGMCEQACSMVNGERAAIKVGHRLQGTGNSH